MINAITRIFRLAFPKSGKTEYGDSPKSFCPMCGKKSYFATNGTNPRPKVRCLHCRSLERHRLLWLFLRKHTDVFKSNEKKILHFAPESCLRRLFKKLYGENYLTADLKKYAMIQMDITDIKFPEESFDVVVCNHVLEHVPDDAKAMSEVHRVLKKGGFAILLCPIADIEKTFEDASITGEKDRLAAYGDHLHIRKYGRDYKNRLENAGFKVKVVGVNDLASEDDIENMRLKEDAALWGFVSTDIYYCEK